MNSQIIRQATAKDAMSVIEIYSPAITESSTSFELKIPSVDEMVRRIESATDRYPWLVLTEDQNVIGYAYATPFRARAAYQFSAETSVYVHRDHHRKGIARKLMLELIKLLKAARHHMIIAGVTLPNPASVALHESLGFEPVGVFPEVGFKFNEWHDVGFWSLKL